MEWDDYALAWKASVQFIDVRTRILKKFGIRVPLNYVEASFGPNAATFTPARALRAHNDTKHLYVHTRFDLVSFN